MTIHPDVVRDAIQRSAIRKSDLAKRAQLNPNTLNKVESMDWSPNWNTLKKLCEAVEEIKRERA